jgi:2-polyprenyl-3-methyl-5-hydroxy-6-metoxy-1,4-benzoquinol methylase
MMLQRDRQPESMDDPKLPKEEHLRALVGLARLNQVSGVARAMYRQLRRHARARTNQTIRVLDVASGGGDIPIAWARWARREGIKLQLTLLDKSSVAIEQQQRRADRYGVDILALQHDCLSTPLPAGFDLVTCSLFMHHLDEHQTFRLLQSMQQATEHALVVCDLDRSRLNLTLVQIAARLLTRSAVVHRDAVLSVRAAYTVEEFKRLAENALARPVRVKRSFPCRFIATFDEETVPQPVPAFA